MRRFTTNDELVHALRNQGTLQSPAVLAAFQRVDRRRFLGQEATPVDAYMNNPIRLSPLVTEVGGKTYEAETVHLSAPYIYARTAEAFELEPGMSFLNVGAGIGYFSSIVAHILGPEGICHGVELGGDLTEVAQALADEFVAEEDAAPMTFLAGNAFSLDPARSVRYDRVYVGAGASADTIPFFKRFVRPGGILVGPFSDELRKCVIFEDRMEESVIMGVSFAPLVRSDRLPRLVHHGGDLVVEAAIWKPHKRHFQDAARSFQDALVAITLLQKRSIGGLPRNLGNSIWHHIFSFCPRDWFEPLPTELLRLRREVDAERNARMLLQEQLNRVQRQRDQAFSLCGVMRTRLMQLGRARAREGREGELDPRVRDMLLAFVDQRHDDDDDFMDFPIQAHVDEGIL